MVDSLKEGRTDLREAEEIEPVEWTNEREDALGRKFGARKD